MKRLNFEKMSLINAGEVNKEFVMDLLDLGCVGVGIFIGIAIPVFGLAAGVTCATLVEAAR